MHVESRILWLCFSKEIKNARFLFSMYAFYENTHYTKKQQKVPFYFFYDFKIARFLKRAFHTVTVSKSIHLKGGYAHFNMHIFHF